jgi:DNA-binding GntR family transcriptional regulator
MATRETAKKSTRTPARAPDRLAQTVYESVKDALFEFRLMPGERFSENDIAARLNVSRTPVREALFRLGQEGYIDVAAKSGWTVRPFDFEYFENLYDVRIVLELAAVRKVCERVPMPPLEELRDAWMVPPESRLDDPVKVAELDERFHAALVAATGNAEMARMHRELTERIRIIRRLDFTSPERIRSTYSEHAQILRKILRRKGEDAVMLLRTHIETSKAEVRKITLHRLHSVRAKAAGPH